MPENPLQRFFTVEERVDGVYLLVDRAQRDGTNIGNLEGAMAAAKVANADMTKIKDVIARARGALEKVGPLFEYYDEKLETYAQVKSTQMQALLRIDPSVRLAGVRVTPVLLEYFLKRRKVVFGIQREVLRDICAKSLYDIEVEVAKGTPPKPGTDGRLDFDLKINPEAKPVIGADGKADFRNIETFVTIAEGQIIARRFPPRAGESGTGVGGETIASPPGVDVVLPSGQNTSITDEGTILRSAKAGVVYMSNGMVSVLELLSIGNDVDFSVGNIKYSGDIVIRGSVMPGFTIEAEGNIEIGGEVEAARIISRNGFVSIRQGVIGRKEAKIYGRQGVSVGFAQETEITTDGLLHVDKHLMHCSASCAILEAGSVIGGTAKVFESAEVHTLGNESGVETSIFIVDKNAEKLKEKLGELLALRGKMVEQMDPIQRELKSKSAMMRKVGVEITDRHRAELKKWVDAYNELAARLKLLDDNVSKLSTAIKNPVNLSGTLRVVGTAWPNARVDLYGVGRRILSDRLERKKFRLHEGIVQEDAE